jgi:small GTP-binding protein
MKCYICNGDSDVSECIVCKKEICREKHAEVFTIDLSVNTDSGHYLESDKYSLTFSCCLEGHSAWEVQNALQKEFNIIPQILKYKKESEDVLKILVVGGTCTGNTTMLKRFIDKRFEPRTRMTLAVDVSEITLQLFNENVKVQFWDLAGPKRFEYLQPTYYMESDSMMVVFDLTRAKTIANLDNIVEAAKKAGIKSNRILLVGNKSDLTDRIVISDEFALKLVEEYKLCSYVKTSAKTGLNIDYAFNLSGVIAMFNRNLINESELKSYIHQAKN